MKKININYCFILFLICRAASAQVANLVPNGDFESYITCPSDYSQIEYAEFWTVPTAFNSSDYYHVCATSSSVGVPTNGAGYQLAHSGDAYAGIYFSAGGEIREYISIALTEPLIEGMVYGVEMHVSLSDYSMYSTDAVSIYFSDTAFMAYPYSTYIPFEAQINNTPGNMLDAVNWTLVSDVYTAYGGESYIIIGNFKSDAESNLTIVNFSGGAYAYAYIDDVMISQTAAISDHDNNSVKLYPNPFTDQLQITADNTVPSEIIIYNITAEKILQQKFSGSVAINASQLTSGIYFYEVRNKEGVIKKEKIVKQ